MITFFFNLLAVVATLVAVLATALYVFYHRKFQYWKDRGVPFRTPKFPFGNSENMTFKVTIGVEFMNFYNQSKHEPYYGIFSFYQPQLMINDPELVKSVFVSDFMNFHDRGIYVNEKEDPLAAHLFSISGTSWRNLRVKLTPTFTSGKMKMMFDTVADVGVKLQNYLEKPASNGEVMEMKDLMARFSTDIISSVAFGLETNSLENPDSEFRKMGRKIFIVSKLEAFKVGLCFGLPSIARLFKIRQTNKEVEDFFMSAVKETIEYREKNNIQRNDFLQLIIQLKNKGYVDDADLMKQHGDKLVDHSADHQKFTFPEAAAQAFVFFVAGFETSSTTMQFCLYELAQQQDIQNKLREEIDKTLEKNDGKITYEALMTMPYLDKVVSETLRKYPPLPILSRECTSEYQVPGSKLVLEKGTIVQIPVLAMQRDPQYYPEPDKFDPERFSEENKSQRHHFVYLPFGEGPRNCIGNRFGLMQTKLGLLSLLSKVEVHISDKTITPMEFDPASFLLSPVGGMYLKLKKRSK